MMLTISNSIIGQHDSSTDYAFFPLEVGNEWIYETLDYHNGDTSDTFLVTFKIVNDTLMPNGKVYYEFYNSFYPENQIFYRADKIEEKVYIYNDSFSDSEFLVYDFNPYQQTFEVLGSNVFVYSGIDLVGLLPIYKSYYEFYFQASVDDLYRLSRDIGISMWGRYNWGFTIGKLIRAKVNGKYYGHITNINVDNAIQSKSFYLNNYPNPFNSQTTIVYNLPEPGIVELSIYNCLGEIVVRYNNYYSIGGEYNYSLNMDKNSSGIYFAKLNYKNESRLIKLINVK